MKVCPKCKIEKPVEEFYRNRSSKDGLQTYCKSCGGKRSVEYYETHKEQRRECYRKYRETHKEQRRGGQLRRNYGITLEEYKDMVEAQNSKCLICGAEAKLHVDHCHISGKIRGLLH